MSATTTSAVQGIGGPSEVVIDIVESKNDFSVQPKAGVPDSKTAQQERVGAEVSAQQNGSQHVIIDIDDEPDEKMEIIAGLRQNIRWIIYANNCVDADTVFKKFMAQAPLLISQCKLKDYEREWADVVRELINDEIANMPPATLTMYTRWKLYFRRTTIASIWRCATYLVTCCRRRRNQRQESLGDIEDSCFGVRQITEYHGKFENTKTPRCVPRHYKAGFTIAAAHLVIPRSCSCNEELALKSRQLLVPLGKAKTRKDAWDNAYEHFVGLVQHWKVVDYDHDYALDLYLRHLSGPQRALYNRAVDDMKHKFLVCPDTKMFTKIEWTIASKGYWKVDPRAISGKHPLYTALTGPKYYWWMKQLFRNFWSSPSDAYKQQFICTAGLNGVEIGALITMLEHDCWIPYVGDFSRYDGRTEVEALDVESRFYQAMGLDPFVCEMIAAQQHTRGRSSTGHFFECSGKFSSGVNNTTGGNTIRGFMLIAFVCHLMNITNYKIVDLGDDLMLFVKQVFDVGHFVELAANFGHKLEMFKPESYDHLEFCSMRFWDVGFQRILAPKPFRTLAKTFMPSDTQLKTDLKVREHIVGVAVGYRQLTWIPVLGTVVTEILRQNHKIRGRVSNRRSINPNKMKWQDIDPSDIDHECLYRQFIAVYGFSPESAENAFSNADFTRVGWHIRDPILEAGLRIDCGQLADNDFRNLAEGVMVRAPTVWGAIKIIATGASTTLGRMCVSLRSCFSQTQVWSKRNIDRIRRSRTDYLVLPRDDYDLELTSASHETAHIPMSVDEFATDGASPASCELGVHTAPVLAPHFRAVLGPNSATGPNTS